MQDFQEIELSDFVVFHNCHYLLVLTVLLDAKTVQKCLHPFPTDAFKHLIDILAIAASISQEEPMHALRNIAQLVIIVFKHLLREVPHEIADHQTVLRLLSFQ